MLGSAAAINLAALAGWRSGSPLLTSWGAELATLKPVTALCLLAIVLALVLEDAGRSRIARYLLGGVLTFTVASLLQDWTGIDLRIDGWIASLFVGKVETGAPWRMSPATAVLIAMIAWGAGAGRRARWPWVSAALAALVCLVELVALAGIAVDPASFYALSGFGSVSVPTVISLLMLSIELMRRCPPGVEFFAAQAGRPGISAWLLVLALVAVVPVILTPAVDVVA